MKQFQVIAGAASLLLSLGACATQGQAPASPVVSIATATSAAPAASAPAQNGLAQLASFTLGDLQAASADAHAQVPPDQTAFQCYDWLIGQMPVIQAAGQPQTVGAILAFQKARDLLNGVSSVNGTLKNLNLACAPLANDVQVTLAKLGLLAAGAGVTGGAAGALLAPLPLP